MNDTDAVAATQTAAAVTIGRRGLIAGAAGLAAASMIPARVRAGETAIELPSPEPSGGASVLEAMRHRQSTRAFSPRALDTQQLSNLLFSAFGINRRESEGHTAPSWHGVAETDVYVAKADGVFRYDPKGHALVRVLADDIRPEIGQQPFVAGAPVILLYVADKSRGFKAPDEERTRFAWVDTAIAAENVYLFAAAFGLATVLVGSIKQAALTKRLDLGPTQLLTYGQPVGYPA